MTSRPSDEAILGLYVWADVSTTDNATTNESIESRRKPILHLGKAGVRQEWELRREEAMWLRDLLPHHVKNARIATFSYLSDWYTYGKGVITSVRELGEQLLNALWQNRQNVRRRPIVFVGHSMGGLVIKQALVLASNRPKFEDIKFSTVGVVFLGTPHAGSHIADYGAFIAKVKNNDPALVESLKPTVKGLYDLSMDFEAGYKTLKAMFFYEKVGEDYATGLGGIVGRLAKFKVVEQQSAAREGRDTMYLLTDHSGLNKFSGEEDPNFRPVCAAIENMARDGPQIVRQRRQDHQVPQSRIKPIFNVPFSQDDKFTGRKVFLDEIDERLKTRNCVSLHGIGGIGKSQIVTEYAYEFRPRYQNSHVFWISGAGFPRFRHTYQDVARQLHLSGADNPENNPCEIVAQWLNDNNNDNDDVNNDGDPQWLVILDNADNTNLFFPVVGNDSTSDVITDGEMPLIHYLPTRLSSKRQMVVTSRDAHLGEDLTQAEPSIAVPPFSSTESQTLFQLKARVVGDQGDQSSMSQLLDVLGYIPLAITQASAFMNRNWTPLVAYLAMLSKDSQNLTDHLSRDLQDPRRERGMPNAVFRTWKLSFDQIQVQERFAADLISLMAMLDRQKIPAILLRREDRELDFIQANGTLEGLSLITREVGHESFAIHRLVQLSIRYWLGLDKRETLYEEQALRLLAESFPNGGHKNKKMCESLLPHAQVVLQYDLTSKSNILPRATLLHNVGWFDLQQRRYNAAYSEVVQAYQLRRDVLGDANQETLQSLGLQATISGYQGKYEQAEEMHRQTLRLRETASGKEHPDTLISMNNLATVLSSQGNHKQAEEMHRQTLRLRETALGKEHPDTLTSMTNLASEYWSLARYNKAEPLEIEVIEIRKQVQGPKHPDTLTSMVNLAYTWKSLNRDRDAIVLVKEAETLQRDVLGSDHPCTINSAQTLERWLVARPS